MSREEPWELWASAMLAVGATNPRLPDRPSWRQLANRAGITTQTVINAARGEVDTEIDVIRQIAKALRVSPETVSEWVGRSRAVSTRYAPPAEADLLTERQRKALTELIRSMVTDEQRAGEDRADSPAPMSDAGATPANVRPIRPAPKSSRAPSSKAARGGNDDRPPPVGDGGA